MVLAPRFAAYMNFGVRRVTVTVVCPLTAPTVALTFAEPGPRVFATPIRPGEVLTRTTAVSLDDQPADCVTSCCDPSVSVPVAVSCWLAPSSSAGFGGVTATDTTVAAVTVRDVLPLIAAPVTLRSPAGQ